MEVAGCQAFYHTLPDRVVGDVRVNVRTGCVKTESRQALTSHENACYSPKSRETMKEFIGLRSVKVFPAERSQTVSFFGPAAHKLVEREREWERGTGRSGKLEVVAGMGNTFGTLFRVTTFGESHGGGVGCIIDGCPPRLPLSEADMQIELDRRRPGQSRITTPRKETDTCRILSGVAYGITLGTPIAVSVPNTDQRGGDYSEMALAYRPSHADATYDFKYGVRAIQGGGRSSARETIGRVAAGAVAKKLLKSLANTEVLAYVSRVHNVELPEGAIQQETLTMEQVESNIVRCPDESVAEEMIKAIDTVRVRGDSCGGVVTCIARNVPKGLGSPVFDKLEAELAKALMSLPATKGFEIGSGFQGSLMLGSEHNDEFYVDENGEIRTRTNRSGGIQGGISNGEMITMRIAFKPTSTITRNQKTVTRGGEETELRARGRHDPCVVPRAVPMVEAMVALVLADQLLQHHAQCLIMPPMETLPSNLEVNKPLSLAQQAAIYSEH